MGEPFIGKKIDVANKLAIAQLLKDNNEAAEEIWLKALEENPTHFDTKVNYEMFRWKNAIISDDELVDYLKESVFKNQDKGPSLHGIICIALGEKEDGMQILEKYNAKEQEKLMYNDPSENLRRKRARD